MDNDFQEDDDALWQEVASDFVPLKNKKPTKIIKESAPILKNNPILTEIKIATIIPAPLLVIKETKPGYLEAGDMSRVDGSVAQKLIDGDYPIDGRLDLHGCTQDEAFESLHYFITTAYSMEKRCILIITGKGENGHGVLREQFPKWLDTGSIREYILAFVHAKPKHGGDGAFYVLLRKNR